MTKPAVVSRAEPEPPPRPPSELFGALFERVQTERLFPDSKTFPDLAPLETPERILQRFEAEGPLDREGLRRFVAHYFTPAPAKGAAVRQDHGLAAEIGALWSTFLRRPAADRPYDSLLQTGHAYVVPGGRFAEAYYWDSYFSLIGLVAEGRQAEAEDIVRGFGVLIDRFGFIPNGARTYYLGRSQPPLFYLMADLVGVPMDDGVVLTQLVQEHGFWMSGSEALAPGAAERRAVCLSETAILNRYWDDSPAPRDEAYVEDLGLAQRSERPPQDLYRDIRAACESGWDFSSRWMADPSDLATIRTTRVVPADLNAFLWGLERAISGRARARGELALTSSFRDKAERRASAMRTWLLDPKLGVFADYDLDAGRTTGKLNAALAAPLFVGLATAHEAEAAARAIETHLLRPGGVAATEVNSGQQWDAPNGWAPLQWFAVAGLARYGHLRLAHTIADRWLTLVERIFDQTGALFEKYDVEQGAAGRGGEYAPQNGFGWTNGVTLALMKWRAGAPLSRWTP